MSYIKKELSEMHYNNNITDFLTSEGFEKDTGPQGTGLMNYATSNDFYIIWITLHEKHIELYQEYECGGVVDTYKSHFIEDNFDSFMDAYKDIIAAAKYRLNI